MACTLGRASARLLLTAFLGVLWLHGSEAYENNFNGPLSFRCRAGYGLTHISSYHSDGNEDRRWDLGCAKVGTGYTHSVQDSGGYDYQQYDDPIDLNCGTDYYLEYLASVHSDGNQDRVWRFECRQANKIRLLNCGITNYVNNWDGPMDYTADSNSIITGLASYHDNWREDRRWRIRHCDVECDLNYNLANSGNRGCSGLRTYIVADRAWANNFQAAFSRVCPQGERIGYMESEHSDTYEDRRWKLICAKPHNAGAHTSPGWSTATYNRLRINWSYYCPHGSFITGVRAAFVKGSNDRVYSWECTRMDDTVLSQCAWSSNINNYDGSGSHQLGSDRVYAGVFSSFSAQHSDRIWYFYACKLECSDGTARNSLGTCTGSICPALSVDNGVVSGQCNGVAGDRCDYVDCDPGYRRTGSPGTRVCQSNGQWTSQPFSCEPVTCGRLSDPLVRFRGSCNGDYGDKCNYEGCVDGYALRGTTVVRTCGENGWSGTAPTCERLTCGTHPKVKYANHFGDCDGNPGDICTISCYGGFVMVPGATLPSPQITSECVTSGSGTSLTASWSNTGFKCQQAYCDWLRLSLGITSGDCYGSLHNVCRYASCNREYALSSDGDATRTCSMSGNRAIWTGSPKRCERVTCPPLSVSNGDLSASCQSGTLYSTCSLTCNDGYWPGGSGETSISCNLNSDSHSASWSSQLQVCKEVRCPPLTLANGQTSGNCNGQAGGTCTYQSCNNGFRFSSSGDRSRTCQQDGPVAQWTGQEKTCLEVIETEREEPISAQCASGQLLIGIFNTPSGSRSQYAYLCQEAGDAEAKRIFARHEDVHRSNEAFDFQCGDNVFALSGVHATWPGNEAARMWSYECALIARADLVDCREESGTYDWARDFSFVAPESRVITGLRSPTSGTGGYKIRTCEVQCRESDGYFETAPGKCEPLSCSSLDLDNGQTSGRCVGKIGDSCTYESCDAGYEMSSSGDNIRDCEVHDGVAQWSGSAKTCERIVTTVDPTTASPCEGLHRSRNATTCRERCSTHGMDSTFFRDYEGCTHVCTCGCRSRYKITKDEEKCVAHCSSMEDSLQAAFHEKLNGCRKVCLCQQEGVEPTETALGPVQTPAVPDYAQLLDFPHEALGYTRLASGTLAFGSAFDDSRLLAIASVASVSACLRLCDANTECVGAVLQIVGSELQCRQADAYEPFISTSFRSISLGKRNDDGGRREIEGRETDTVETVAGNGGTLWNSDVSSPTDTGLSQMGCVTGQGLRFLIVSLISEHRVIRVDLFDNSVKALAGTGKAGSSGVGGDATSAQLDRPTCAVADETGNIYVAEEGNHRVSFVDVKTGKLRVVVGTGKPGHRGMGGAGHAAQVKAPTSLALDADGLLYIADSENHVVYRYNPRTAVVRVIAGTPGVPGFRGDGSFPAHEALLNRPMGLACAANNQQLFIADTGNNRVRVVGLSSGGISTVAGAGPPGDGDGLDIPTPGMQALLYGPEGVAVDSDGSTLVVADTRNNAVRMIDLTNDDTLVSRVLGSGYRSFNGDTHPPAETNLNSPVSVAFTNSDRAVVVVDQRNRRVRRVWL